MTMTLRLILTLMLMLPVAGRLLAQEATTTPTSTAATATAPATTTAQASAGDNDDDRDPSRLDVETNRVEQIQSGLGRMVRRQPESVALALDADPTLLLNQEYMGRYPDLAAYVAANPEIRRNPHLYSRQIETYRPTPRSPLDDAIETLSIIMVFFLIAFALGWIVKTIIEHKRWNQLSKRQNEVHGRLLDRFATSEELLAYIKTPAGSKYLESAPIAVGIEPVKTSPYARLLLSIQIGVVVVAASIGLMITGARFGGGSGQGLFGMGTIAFCIGGGFIASAFVSLFLARRLEERATNSAEDSGLVR